VAWNRYVYVDWNPIRYSDPNGHATIENTGFEGGDFSNKMISKPYSNVDVVLGGWNSNRLKSLNRATAIAAHLQGGPNQFKKSSGELRSGKY